MDPLFVARSKADERLAKAAAATGMHIQHIPNPAGVLLFSMVQDGLV